MKRSIVSAFVCMLTVICAMSAYADANYKGFISAGGAVAKGDTYEYVMGVDGKIGLTLRTEHGICFNPSDWGNAGIFAGVGVGFDYVNVGLSEFDDIEFETTDILSNTVMAVPLYLTLKYIYNVNRLSMVYAVRGGFYRWYRGHIYEHNHLNKDYELPYKKSYMVGFGLGVRFPIMRNYGMSIMVDFDYMGANVKWHDENLQNNKVGVSLAFDF